MNYTEYLADKAIRVSLLLSVLMTGVVSGFVFFLQNKLPPYIPFFNSMPWGEKRLYTSQIMPFFPIIMLAIIGLNYVLGSMYYKKYSFGARILSLNALLFVLLGSLSYVFMMILVF